VNGANRRQAEVIERLHIKRTKNADPVMSNAPGWMADALKVANAVIARGEGDLSSMGEFADVEYKVGGALRNSGLGLLLESGAGRIA
jgi:hypothetical protein